MYLCYCSVVNDLSASCNSVGFISNRDFFFTFLGVTHVGSEAEKQELSSGGYAYTTSCLVKGTILNCSSFKHPYCSIYLTLPNWSYVAVRFRIGSHGLVEFQVYS